jgi:hypothetical protein
VGEEPAGTRFCVAVLHVAVQLLNDQPSTISGGQRESGKPCHDNVGQLDLNWVQVLKPDVPSPVAL